MGYSLWIRIYLTKVKIGYLITSKKLFLCLQLSNGSKTWRTNNEHFEHGWPSLIDSFVFLPISHFSRADNVMKDRDVHVTKMIILVAWDDQIIHRIDGKNLTSYISVPIIWFKHPSYLTVVRILLRVEIQILPLKS